jgi:hypothetical protein
MRKFTVLVDDRAGVSIQKLAAELQEHGFVEQLEAIGVLVGRIDEGRVEIIRALPGVAAVEEERQIGPS